jgi:hypothetical protein
MIPVLANWSVLIHDFLESGLRFVSTPVVSQLTGLSTDKLREWTSRRALIPADVRPKRKGCPAKFSWQTVLLLRVAVVLRDQFSLELQSHKAAFDSLRKELQQRSFIALWGQRLALQSEGAWLILGEDEPAPLVDYLSIRLDPHLAVLRDGFALFDPLPDPGQLDLFSLPAIHKKTVARAVKPASAGRGRLA